MPQLYIMKIDHNHKNQHVWERLFDTSIVMGILLPLDDVGI